MKTLQKLKQLLSGQLGQSTVEYSFIAHAILIVGGVTMIKVMPLLFDAYQTYLNGFYFTLNLPLP
jgi:hypothetical protein